jgi:hypothetical protein
MNTSSSEDANAQLYQALMLHKQQEQQRVQRVLKDNQSITEAMLQKRKEAQQSRLVVSAIGEQYVNNARLDYSIVCVFRCPGFALTHQNNWQVHTGQQWTGPQNKSFLAHACSES